MSSKAVQCKQRLMELSPAQLQAALSRFYATKGAQVVLRGVQKAYKFFEVAVLSAGKRVCSGYGRSEEEATLNACRIAFEAAIDTSSDRDLRVFDSVLDAPQSTSELEQFLRQAGLETLEPVLEREELGLAELKIIDREDLRRTLNLQTERLALSCNLQGDMFTRLWSQVESLRPKQSGVTVKVEGETALLRIENEKLKSYLHLDSPPRYLVCPLTQELITDPVSLSDGFTYEREAAELWLATHAVSPVTGGELLSRSMRDNVSVREMLEEYRALLETFKGKNGDLRRNLYQTSYGHHLPAPTQPPVQDLERQADEIALRLMNSRRK